MGESDMIGIAHAASGGRVRVPLVARDGGLAVVEAEPNRYSVTHVASGLRLWPSLESQRPYDPEPARRAMQVALASGIDWRRDRDAITAAHGAAWPALRHRMRLAAWPPRRSRWHGDHRARRARPWVAARRAQAYREATRADLRSCVRDLFDPTRWREAFYGTELIRPQRQRCARFVNHRAARRGVVRRMARRAHGSLVITALRNGTAEDRVMGVGVVTWDARGRVAAFRPYGEVLQ